MNNEYYQNDDIKSIKDENIEKPKKKIKGYKEKLTLEDFAELFLNVNEYKNNKKEKKFLFSLDKNGILKGSREELNDNEILDINKYKSLRNKTTNSKIKIEKLTEAIKTKNNSKKIKAPPFSLRLNTNSQKRFEIIEDEEKVKNEINIEIIPDEENLQKSKKRKQRLYKLYQTKN